MATLITNTDLGNSLYVSFINKLEARDQLRGNNYIVVYGNNTPGNNGADLVSKLNFAKFINPNSQVKSDTNRMTVLVAPGKYDVDFTLEMDTPYVDLISLTGNADVFLNCISSNTTILVDSSDISVKGFNLGSKAITINGSYSNNYFENIIGGDYNFSHPSTSGDVAGNFKNCVGGLYSFGDADNGQILSTSTLENCTAGDWSFGYVLYLSNLKNCTAGFSSFGYIQIDNCNLTDCKSTAGDSFGTNSGIAASTLTNCSATSYSFGRTNGYTQILNSTFIDCTAEEEGSFGTYIEGCTFRNCTAGRESFGKTSDIGTLSEIFSSTFTDCKAGDWSFGVRIGGTDVVFTNCTAGIESFGANEANGTYKNCRAGINSFGAGLQGWPKLQAGGQFFNCVADENSFGTEIANGAFYYCVCNGVGGWRGNTQGGMGGYAFSCKGMNPAPIGQAIYCVDTFFKPVNFNLTTTTNNI